MFKIVIFKTLTLYPRFLLTFSKNKYNNTKFYNEEFLRVYFMKTKRSLSKYKDCFKMMQYIFSL